MLTIYDFFFFCIYSLIELINNNIISKSKGYIIGDGKVFKTSKKGSETILKPLIQKDTDKLIMPLIESIYILKMEDNYCDCC